MFHRALFVVMALIGMLGTISRADEGKGLREELVASENTRQVYAIDNVHTLVIPAHTGMQGEITEEFIRELQGTCIKTMIVNESKTVEDPITGKQVEQVTTKPFDGKRIENGLSCAGQFEIVKVFGETRSSSTWGSFFFVKSFILRHKQTQPFAYKTEAVPSLDKISTPKEGPVSFLTSKPVESSIGRGIMAAVGGIGSLFGSKQTPYDDEDLCQYLLALAKKSGSSTRFIINVGRNGAKTGWHDLFKEVDATEAFAYIYETNPTHSKFLKKKWFMALDGPIKLVASVRHKDKGMPDSYIALNRGVEGIDFSSKE